MGKTRDERGNVQHHDFVCTACGLMCDDLTLEAAGDRVVAFSPPCPLAERFFLRELDAPTAPCTIAGEPADLGDAVARAAELLAAARAPLIMGLERTTCDAQRAAVEIADRLGAYLDPTDDHGRSPSHAAMQTIGAVGATIGEIAGRSTLALYWEADPLATHPRHIERVATGKVIAVDSRRTATAMAAHEFLQIRPGSGFECLSTLRAVVRGVELDAATVERQTGVALDAWRALADQLKSSTYPAVFHDGDDVEEGVAVTQLVHDLHRYAHLRAVALPLGRSANAAGAAQVLTWQTGFPAAISFAAGYPSYSPGEATAATLLARREVDAALVIGADPLPHLSLDAAARLRSIPLIVLDDRSTDTLAAAAVAIRTAVFGLQTSGDVYRSDGVALPLRPALRSTLPSTAAVLAQLSAQLPLAGLPLAGSTRKTTSRSSTP